MRVSLASEVFPGDLVVCSYSGRIQLVIGRADHLPMASEGRIHDDQGFIHYNYVFDFRLLGRGFNPGTSYPFSLIQVIT